MDCEILTLTPDPENRVVGIRLYQNMPMTFNSEEEMTQWKDLAISEAFELKEAIEMGFCDMSDERIFLDPNVPANEVDKLKKLREDSKFMPQKYHFDKQTKNIKFHKKNLDFRISPRPPANGNPLAKCDG